MSGVLVPAGSRSVGAGALPRADAPGKGVCVAGAGRTEVPVIVGVGVSVGPAVEDAPRVAVALATTATDGVVSGPRVGDAVGGVGVAVGVGTVSVAAAFETGAGVVALEP